MKYTNYDTLNNKSSQKMTSRFGNLKYKLFIFALMIIYLIIAVIFRIPCPFNYVTGISCPGCGMTRAWRELLKLNFAGAFSNHLMFWSVPIILYFLLVDGKIFRKKVANATVFFGVIIGFAINWFYQLLR